MQGKIRFMRGVNDVISIVLLPLSCPSNWYGINLTILRTSSTGTWCKFELSGIATEHAGYFEFEKEIQNVRQSY